MLKNDKVNLVIAFIIAIVLWGYVGEVNAETHTPHKNIPITFLNEKTLADDGLVILSKSDTTVNVTISGKRSDTTKVNASDIRVYADLEGFNEGEHMVRLKISVPDSVELYDVSKQKVKINIDKLVSEEKNITASITGETNDESEPYIVQISKDRVLVTGAKSLVDQVVRVDAPLENEKVDNKLKAFNVQLLPKDKNGEVVEGVTLGNKSVSISAVLLNKKTVNLDVPVVGQSAGGAERVVTLPKAITLKGTDAILAEINSIVAETINVGDIYEDTSVPVVPILPKGVEVASNSQNLVAKITVKGMETATFEYNQDAVVLEGITEEQVIEVTPVDISLTVTGKESVITELKPDDFYFRVDVANLEPGKYMLPLICEYAKGISEIELSPKEIEVTIE